MDPLNRLTRLIAEEENPHELITQVAADAELMRLVRSFNGTGKASLLASDERLRQACRTNQMEVNYFWDRVGLISRILNLKPAEEDYYNILELKRDVSPEQIKRAFRRLSLAYHPDVNREDPEASDQFQRIHQAYETLGDPKLRNLYDQTLTQTEWVEPPSIEASVKSPRLEKRRKFALAFGGLLALLLALIFLVDFQSWQTRKYYQARSKVRPDSKSAALNRQPADVAEPGKDSKTVTHEMLASLQGTKASNPPYIASTAEIEDGGLAADADLSVQSQATAIEAAAAEKKVEISNQQSAQSKETILSPGNSGSAKPQAAPGSSPQKAKQTAPERSPLKPPAKTAPAKSKAPVNEGAKKEIGQAGSSKKQATKTSVSKPAKLPKPAPAQPAKPTSAQPPKEPAPQPKITEKIFEKPGQVLVEVIDLPAELVQDPQPKPAPAAPVTPRKADQAKSPKDLASKVHYFLASYEHAYERKNLRLFLTLFAPQAVENGTPIINLKNAYRHTFETAERIRFHIKSIRWSEQADGIEVAGKFQLELQPKNGAPVTSTGPIRFNLIQQGDSFRVKSVSYSFMTVSRD